MLNKYFFWPYGLNLESTKYDFYPPWLKRFLGTIPKISTGKLNKTYTEGKLTIFFSDDIRHIDT